MKRRGGTPFAKFSGAGNDFILLDARRASLPRRLGEWVRAVCRRGVSLGADGVVVLESGRAGALRVRFYNPDGGRHDFCGNGTRCAARWEARRRGRMGEVVLDTDAGQVRARVRGGEVQSGLAFALGKPRLLVLRTGGRHVRAYAVTAGVPHLVILREVADTRPLPPLAARLRSHPALRGGANVDFVGAPRRGVRPIRTYERGVEGETLACGSGCVAAALVLLQRQPGLRSPVRFRVRSGAVISIRFRRRGRRLDDWRLCGEARLICEGVIDTGALGLRGGPA